MWLKSNGAICCRALERAARTPAGKEGRTVAHLLSVPVHSVARSNSLAAVEGSLQAGSLVLLGGPVEPDQPCTLRRFHFPSRPSLEEFSSAAPRPAQSSTGTLPVPKRGSVLQRLFGL